MPEQDHLVHAYLQDPPVNHLHDVGEEPEALEKVAVTYFFDVLANCGLRLVAFNAEKKSSHTIES